MEFTVNSFNSAPSEIGKKLLHALSEEFPLVGGVDLIEIETAYREHFQRFEDWIEAGFAGEMSYLKRGLERRADLQLVLPGAKSVLCVGMPYSARRFGSENISEGVQYARYIRGRDYHQVIPELIAKALEKVIAQTPELNLKYKICCDTSSVLERSLAYFSGLGWLGKNTLLIHPTLGSYFLIGVVIIDQELGLKPSIQRNLCGNCSRCIEGCPTQAFVRPGTLNANRCISYLTLEKKSDFSTEEKDWVSSSNFVAGCDVCQEVCPFNYKRSKREQGQGNTDQDLPVSLDRVSTIEEVEFKSLVKNSSLGRVKFGQFLRNRLALISKSNSVELSRVSFPAGKPKRD